MPQALAYALPTLFGAGGSFALVTGAAFTSSLTTLGSIVSIGASLAVSALARQRPPSVDPANVQLNIKQAIGDRIKHVGRVRVGGTIVFFRAAEGKFYRVIVHGHGEIDAIESYILDKKAVTLGSEVIGGETLEGWVQDDQYEVDGTKLVRILTRSGLGNETYYSEIEAQWAAWDEDHRLDGLCTSLTIAESVDPEDFGQVYPNREPSLELVLRGAKVRDPRATTAWSDNAGLIIGDLIEDPDAFNLAGLVDDDWLTTAADDSDDDIPLAAGGTEKRWRIWGSYSRTEAPDGILRRMLDVCGGDVKLLPNGKIGIAVGSLPTPTVTLTRDELISIDDWVSGPDAIDRYTELPFRYVDPNLAYQQTTGEPWVDEAREAENGGQAAVGPEADFIFCPSSTQGDRAAWEKMERDNPAYITTLTFKPSARRALYELAILLDIDELPSGFWWRIDSYGLDTITGRVTFVLKSYVKPVWSTEYEGQPQTMPDPAVGGEVPAPTTVKAAGTGIDGTAGIAMIWDPRPSVALSPVLRYSPAGADEWDDWPLAATTRKTLIAPLANGADYDLELYWETNDGLQSATPVTFSAVVAGTDSAPLAAPSDLAVSDDTGGEARVTFTTVSDARLYKTDIYRMATAVSPDPGFDDPGEWSTAAGWAVSGGKATHATGVAGDLSQALDLLPGETLEITFTISGRTTGLVTPKIAGATVNSAAAVGVDGTYVVEIVVPAAAPTGNAHELRFTATGNFNGSIDNLELAYTTTPLTLAATSYADGGEAVEIIDPCGAGSFIWSVSSVDLTLQIGSTSPGVLQTIT